MLTAAGAQAGVVRGLPCLLGVTTGMGVMMFIVPLGLGTLVLRHPVILTGLHWGGAAAADAGALTPRLRARRPRGRPLAPNRLHRRAVLVGVETDLEVRLHLASEGVEVEVEGARAEPLAGAHARRRQREELLHRGVQLTLEVGGRHDAVHQPVALRSARVDRLAEQDQLACPRGADE